jgi:signal transduction histidine kinase
MKGQNGVARKTGDDTGTAPAAGVAAAPPSALSRVTGLAASFPVPAFLTALPMRLLLLTAAFVMSAEMLIFVPTLASFRINWLEERLAAAQLAALAVDSFPGGTVPSSIRAELLRTAQVKAVASRQSGQRRLVLPVDNDMKIDAHYDLRQTPDGAISTLIAQVRLFSDTLGVLWGREGRNIRVLGRLGAEPDDLIEIVMPEAPLRAVMWEQSRNVFWLSLLISLLSAGLVYLSLYLLVVRPITRLSRNMQLFSQNPEDAGRVIVPSARLDEIGTAERELEQMQRQLAQLLAQKSRLAQLGLAVSKINHDLRNMLSSAQVISDRLTAIPDATVQRFAPKLISSLDRAINFCNDTLRFGQSEETHPRRELLALLPLVEEVGDGLGLPREGAIDWVMDFDERLRIDADPDHLYRILSNLVRNAVQAIETQADQDASAQVRGRVRKPGVITVTARRDARRVIVDVADTGPGVPLKARANLFQAFQSSNRKGGSGLGLAVSAELAAAHGGSLRLLDGDAGRGGAVFRLEMPDRSAQ